MRNKKGQGANLALFAALVIQFRGRTSTDEWFILSFSPSLSFLPGDEDTIGRPNELKS